jgi:hypothetical protein
LERDFGGYAASSRSFLGLGAGFGSAETMAHGATTPGDFGARINEAVSQIKGAKEGYFKTPQIIEGHLLWRGYRVGDSVNPKNRFLAVAARIGDLSANAKNAPAQPVHCFQPIDVCDGRLRVPTRAETPHAATERRL